MRSRDTLWLLAAACAMAVLVWGIERRFDSAGERFRRSGRLLESDAGVTGLRVETADLRVDCARRGDGWALTYPVEARANDGAVERILSVLGSLPRRDVITADERRHRELTLADYGLLDPRARFVVATRQGTREILVGCESPLGNMVYVKLGNEDDVYGTAGAILDVIPGSVTAVRDRTVLAGDGARAVRMEIHRTAEGFIKLGRAGGRWMIEQPVAARADAGRVSRMLDALYALQVESFVWDPPAGGVAAADGLDAVSDPGARMALYGLSADEAVMRIAVWPEGEEAGDELVLGKPTDAKGLSVYARRRDFPSVFAVTAEIVAAFSADAGDLRDRILFPVDASAVRRAGLQYGEREVVLQRREDGRWMIVAPVEWQADEQAVEGLIQVVTRWRAESFCDAPATNLASYGLDRPVGAVWLSVSEAGGSAEPSVLRLEVGIVRTNGLDGVFARFADRPEVVRLPAAAIEALGPDPADPLAYRDRTMLAVPPASVKKITLLANGREQSVSRDASGDWLSSTAGADPVCEDVIDDILLAAANLRALRLESRQPRLEDYGLDRPARTLVLGLTGEGGIQNTLLLGSPAPGAGVYAMVQGQDVVFVLPEDAVERITRDLAEPAAETP